jgi:hypothetical protein
LLPDTQAIEVNHMVQMERSARDMGPINTADGEADALATGDQRHTEAREDPTWNPGGVGNDAGAAAGEMATPASHWNPGGVGNVKEPEEDDDNVSTGTTSGTEAERTGSTATIPVDSEDSDDWDRPGQKDTGQ